MPDTLAGRSRAAVTTPGWLRRGAGVIVLLAALAAAASLWAGSRIGDAAQTIGRDAEPSVALALRMSATLGDLDAAALADALTDGGAAIGTSVQFADGLRALTADLVLAAQNITYGEAEAGPIRELQRALIAYEQAVVEARAAGQDDPWLMSHRLQWASRVDRDRAVPQAEALADVNADQLERRYASYRATSLIYGLAGFLAFGMLVAALLAMQIWLARRVRRVVNPLLAAATLAAGLGGLWFGATVLTERADLRAAKFDAYDSLHVLFEAKAAANRLRAEMSLWLLDPAARVNAQAGMDAAAHAMIGTDLGRPDLVQQLHAGLQAALALERQGRPDAALAAAPKPGGLLGAELANVTFGMPERLGADDSVARLADAAALVRAVQRQDEPRTHVFAVTRWLGDGAQAFAALQSALDRTIAVNQSEFDRRVTSALGTARLLPQVACAALALAAALAIGGLWLRLREYR